MPCPECGAQMSVTAKACPNCAAGPGGKSSAMPMVWIGAVVLVIAAFVWGGVGRPDSAMPVGVIPKGPGLSAEERQKEAEFQLVLVGAKALKARAKNPDAFKLERALLMPSGTICYEYRGTNSFNAVVLEQAAWTDKGGTTDAAAWNKHCAGKSGGKDYSHARAVL